MDNKIIIGIIVVIVIVGGYMLMQKKYAPAPQQTTSSNQSSMVQPNAVTIKNFTFNPETLTVKQGTKVIWTNQDSAIHTIKSDTFNSPDLSQGNTFEFTFTTKGSFDYRCGIHPSMKGRVIVK